MRRDQVSEDRYDVIAHYVKDGKEYDVMCYPNVPLREAEVLADELRKTNEKMGRQEEIKIVTSFGVY